MMEQRKLGTRSVWLRGVVATVIATLLNAIVALVAVSALGVPDFRALQPGPVITVTVAAMLAGTLVYAVLGRFLSRPGRWFAGLAGAIAIVSLAAPVSLASNPAQFPGATPAAALALVPLHLIPAVSLTTALLWRAKE